MGRGGELSKGCYNHYRRTTSMEMKKEKWGLMGLLIGQSLRVEVEAPIRVKAEEKTFVSPRKIVVESRVLNA
ncbi:hypothetical protein Csa_010289 [Cucumis sativus]|uniref:Uncharacterized protein n=1 Tax=Cucumis sativus TaxID=3659 RepID=A0A0A0L2F9_CUCSA|nr:hypothetical protein Csa_010289 [Cucumis sativus]